MPKCPPQTPKDTTAPKPARNLGNTLKEFRLLSVSQRTNFKKKHTSSSSNTVKLVGLTFVR